VMLESLRILQLNAHKSDVVQQSLMNDAGLKDFAVLALSEPYARNIGGEVVTSPMGHHNWTKMIPTCARDGLWPIRSMLWIRSDLEAEQVPVPSADLTAAVLRLEGREVMVVSVYVQGKNDEALTSAMELLRDLIDRFRDGTGNRTDVVLAGDFNRHDLLWGGDEVSASRQGEGQPIIDLMNEFGLSSLLPRGTKTWQRADEQSTIDLVLASAELADEVISCMTHPTEHGSDHRAIQTAFDIQVPEKTFPQRLMLKNAPWIAIATRVEDELRPLPWSVGVQTQADQLMRVVTEVLHDLTPRAQPPPYAKRWWTKDLTRLRQTYTYWRNQARAQRRAGQPQQDLEQRAKDAAKEYHDNVRKQKKSHWDDFVTDENNIWKVVKYLKPGVDMFDDKVPPLRRDDGSITKGKGEQGEELLSTFFPPLPTNIEPEGERPQREEIAMPDLTLQEIEEKVMVAKPWKAPGEDGLPAIVWKKLWHVVKHRVWTLFDSSLREGVVPHQWRTAKIIPLKKPGKDDYTLAKAWRPISLLSTLGKILEAVVAERISYAVEAHGLLPANHFGARKRRSADQALVLLQERIYKAWRMGRVLSLVSFDVKGAYNGVCKERLLERMKARGIPNRLVKWVDAFCSERTASVVVNGHTSEQQALAQAGLPQGSPLSPVAFLFFNADLVQRRISNNSGSIAFVDDYSAWVTGPTAESNRDGIQSIINYALEWEKRSGATFEVDKTSVIHFTRIAERDSDSPFAIRGNDVKPKENVKLLGVIMDQALRFKEHIAGVAAKGLTAAMCLKRLKMASPQTARQLFTATVTPTMDYASNVWSHACKTKEATWIERAQRIGAQAITGGFRTVATAVAEAEASVQSFRERHAQAASRFWIRTQTLPRTHPLTCLKLKLNRRYASPMQKLASTMSRLDTKRVEVIHEFALAPWDERVQATYETDRLEVLTSDDPEDITIATSSSQRKGKVGLGGVVRDASRDSADGVLASYSVTLGPSGEQNAYTAGLEAIATALRCVPLGLRDRDLTVVTSNRSVLQVIGRPRQQSGQCTIRAIYGSVEFLAKRGCKVRLRWVPAKNAEFTLGPLAKMQAKRATRDECIAEPATFQARSTTLRLLLNEHTRVHQIPEGVGKHSKRIDKALPGKHTRKLYDELTRKESEVLVQLRTGKSRLNSYLCKIGAVESDECTCGQSAETVEHFLFRCRRWTVQREIMLRYARGKMGDLSFFLGGKAESDDDKWQPDMGAVRATIQFALATKRFNMDRQRAIC
jgi:hypothetical protein